jgi:hypothetical protein
MRNAKWILLLVGVLACGLIAAGCGDDDDSSSSTVATEESTSTTDETTSDDTETTTEDSGDDSSEASTPDDVYNACVDVIEGTPAEAAGMPGCESARDAFEQCTKQAESITDDSGHDLAVQACQDAADQAVAALEASG